MTGKGKLEVLPKLFRKVWNRIADDAFKDDMGRNVSSLSREEIVELVVDRLDCCKPFNSEEESAVQWYLDAADEIRQVVDKSAFSAREYS